LFLFAPTHQVLAAQGQEAAGTTPVKSWDVIYDKSTLGFRGDYGGSGFDGQFKKFKAMIQFDPAHPETGHFDVTVDVSSVTTFNDDWDEVIREKDWFDVKNHPTSRYVTDSIKSMGDGKFSATGTLQLKGKKHPVELRFRWLQYPDGEVKISGQARMLAGAKVNRTDFDIGEGHWAEDSTVGFDVMVNVDLLLKPETN
jgi:polyisoprenoid-binding protein YceI